jgi:hypothetical protein
MPLFDPRFLHQVNAVTGPDEMAVAGLIMGSDGAIGSTYNIQPKINVRMHQDFHAGNIAGAMKGQEQANHIIAALINLSTKYNVPILTGVIGGKIVVDIAAMQLHMHVKCVSDLALILAGLRSCCNEYPHNFTHIQELKRYTATMVSMSVSNSTAMSLHV